LQNITPEISNYPYLFASCLQYFYRPFLPVTHTWNLLGTSNWQIHFSHINTGSR